jgi:hypothetical protein
MVVALVIVARLEMDMNALINYYYYFRPFYELRQPLINQVAVGARAERAWGFTITGGDHRQGSLIPTYPIHSLIEQTLDSCTSHKLNQLMQ